MGPQYISRPTVPPPLSSTRSTMTNTFAHSTTTTQPHTNSNPNPNRNHTTKQHAVVSIQLNVVACPTYAEKSKQDDVIAPFSLLPLSLSLRLILHFSHCSQIIECSGCCETRCLSRKTAFTTQNANCRNSPRSPDPVFFPTWPNSVYLVAVKRPRSEFHLAALLVEREVLDVDGAGALVDRRRYPQHTPVAVDHHVWLVRHFVLAVSTAKYNNTPFEYVM